jgi:hypothetical protein
MAWSVKGLEGVQLPKYVSFRAAVKPWILLNIACSVCKLMPRVPSTMPATGTTSMRRILERSLGIEYEIEFEPIHDSDVNEHVLLHLFEIEP